LKLVIVHLRLVPQAALVASNHWKVDIYLSIVACDKDPSDAIEFLITSTIVPQNLDLCSAAESSLFTEVLS
jgi:hypothetical protein